MHNLSYALRVTDPDIMILTDLLNVMHAMGQGLRENFDASKGMIVVSMVPIPTVHIANSNR